MIPDIRTFVAYLSEWLGAIAVVWIFSINPQLQRISLGFRYPRREGIVALALSGLSLVTALVYFLNFPPQFQATLPLAAAPVIDLNQAMIVALLAVLPVVAALYMRGQHLKSAGWDRALLRSALVTGVATALLAIFLRNKVTAVLSNGLTNPNLLLLLLAVVVSVAEETFFRGYIQPRMSAWLGTWIGLISTAALFTIWHLVAWVGRLPLESTLILLGLTFVQGLVCGWIMLKSKSVLAPTLYRAISIWIRLI